MRPRPWVGVWANARQLQLGSPAFASQRFSASIRTAAVRSSVRSFGLAEASATRLANPASLAPSPV